MSEGGVVTSMFVRLWMFELVCASARLQERHCRLLFGVSCFDMGVWLVVRRIKEKEDCIDGLLNWYVCGEGY